MPYSRLSSMADFAFLKVATRIFAEYSSVTSLDASRGSVFASSSVEESRRSTVYKRGETIIRTDSQLSERVRGVGSAAAAAAFRAAVRAAAALAARALVFLVRHRQDHGRLRRGQGGFLLAREHLDEAGHGRFVLEGTDAYFWLSS